MDQLKSINALSKNKITEKDLKRLFWYVLYTEVGKEFLIRDEWVKIKNKVSKESGVSLDNIEVVWTPTLEENIDDKVIITPYLFCYYFVGTIEQMTNAEYVAFKDMSGVVKVISPYIPPSVVSVDYCEMESMFNLPYYPNKVIENSFLIGNSVKIVSGALQNYIGKIKEIRGKRAFIETNILKNFSTDIEISLNSLELVSC